jgi:hypothetical protein
VFVHIPKTAGTTMVKILNSLYPPAQIFNVYRDLRGYAAAHLARYRLIRGHFPLHDVQYVPGPKRIFTILREPNARVLSQYRYHRSRLHLGLTEDVLAKKAELPINQYLNDPWIRRHDLVNNTQTRFLFCLFPGYIERFGIDPEAMDTPFYKVPRETLVAVAKENLAKLATFGLAEQFDPFLELLAAAYGLPEVPTYESQNLTKTFADKAKAPEATGRPPLEFQEPDSRTEQLLAKLNDLDEELYAFGRDLFEERLAEQRARHPAVQATAA